MDFVADPRDFLYVFSTWNWQNLYLKNLNFHVNHHRSKKRVNIEPVVWFKRSVNIVEKKIILFFLHYVIFLGCICLILDWGSFGSWFFHVVFKLIMVLPFNVILHVDLILLMVFE